MRVSIKNRRKKQTKRRKTFRDKRRSRTKKIFGGLKVEELKKLIQGIGLSEIENATYDETTSVIKISDYEYTLSKKLGSGYFGSVWLIQPNKPPLQYKAVKLILIEKMGKEDINELKILQKLKDKCQPDILCYDGYFIQGDNLFLITEYLQTTGSKNTNSNLETFLITPGSLTDESKVKLLINNICKAIERIHKEGIAHRDIKPENIFVLDANTMEIKILDFGSSYDNEDHLHSISISGTPIYMDPYVINTINSDSADGLWEKLRNADLWSVVIMVFEILLIHSNLSILDGYKKMRGNLYNANKNQEIINLSSLKSYLVGYFKDESITKNYNELLKRLIGPVIDIRAFASLEMREKYGKFIEDSQIIYVISNSFEEILKKEKEILKKFKKEKACSSMLKILKNEIESNKTIINNKTIKQELDELGFLYKGLINEEDFNLFCYDFPDDLVELLKPIIPYFEVNNQKIFKHHLNVSVVSKAEDLNP